MMLKDLTDEKLIRLNIEAADWEEAIRKSAQPLIDEHKVKPSYVDDMITGVKENGPYIVLTKHVALPHARPECGVKRNCFSLVVLDKPIQFAGSDRADIVIMFGAQDSNAHIEEGIRAIVALLDNNETMARLRAASTREEVIALL